MSRTLYIRLLPLYWREHRRRILTRNHYQVLGVTRRATPQEIRKAFRSLALRYHPDVTCLDKDLAEDGFKEISGAYWILKDPRRRMEYDLTLPSPTKEVEVTYGVPSPWESQEEDWIWDEYQLRYRKKWIDEEGIYEARSPYRSATLKSEITAAARASRIAAAVSPRASSRPAPTRTS